MANILIVYSTTDGHTGRICERLRSAAEAIGDKVVVSRIDEADKNFDEFDKIVIGASIRYGKHSPEVFEFIRMNQAVLERKPSAFFTVNVVARKPEKNQPDTNPYLLKFLKQIDWQPMRLGVFAGKLDYPKYNFVDRQAIRFIMWMTKGPTDPTAVVEFTDWDSVDDFARTISSM